jgi:anti-sigma regulatory factor (Ser/Thr protein kinase)
MKLIDCFERQIHNNIMELRPMSEWLGKACKNLAMTDQLAKDLDVCANEAVTNIMFYAYKDHDSHQISMRLELKEQKLILTIQDDGIAFDPFNSKAMLSKSYDKIGDLNIGGLGIKLIRSLANEYSYYRSNNRNIISLVFYLCQTSAATPQARTHQF